MLGQCAKGFDRLLRGFSATDIESHAGTVYGLWPDLTLAYVNPAWFQFAKLNGGEPPISADWGIGRSIVDAIPAVLNDFYAKLYREGLVKQAGLRPVTHTYECSSGTHIRTFAMQLYALGDAAGVLVVNSMRNETPASLAGRTAQAASLDIYLDDTGTIHQCAHCRRVRAAHIPNRWDWVPQWVERVPPETSHDLCTICLDYYYPAEDESSADPTLRE